MVGSRLLAEEDAAAGGDGGDRHDTDPRGSQPPPLAAFGRELGLLELDGRLLVDLNLGRRLVVFLVLVVAGLAASAGFFFSAEHGGLTALR